MRRSRPASAALLFVLSLCTLFTANTSATSWPNAAFVYAKVLVGAVGGDVTTLARSIPLVNRIAGPARLAQSQDPAPALPEATIDTDKRDYVPGETVEVTGTGWTGDEEVELIFEEQLSEGHHGPFHFVATVDALGGFVERSFVAQAYDIGVSYRVYAIGRTTGRLWVTTFVDAVGADLDQCANGSLVAPVPCADPGTAGGPDNPWQNGNLNENQAHYKEGDSVPYRLRFTGLAVGAHTVTIEWDTTEGGKHTLDYLTSFNRTEGAAVACDAFSFCSGTADFEPIGPDPNVTGAGVTPVAGNFALYNGAITGVSAYTLSGTYAGNSKTKVSITFTVPSGNICATNPSKNDATYPPTDCPVLAWGGHIATRQDWGETNSAVTRTGSPYHMRLLDVDGTGGNQDRSLSAEAVIFPASITIVKQTDPTPDPQNFNFSTTGGLDLDGFTLDTSDSDGDGFSNSVTYSDILVTANGGNNYTVTETPVALWELTFPSPACEIASENGGSTGLVTNGVSINLREGEDVTCTFINTRQSASLTLVKEIVNDNGGTETDLTKWQLTATGSGSNIYSGPGSTGQTFTVDPDTYTLSESGTVAGYTNGTTYSCVKNDEGAVSSNSIILAGGDVATCTITNDDVAPTLTLVKTVVNDNGGNKQVSDFPLFINGVAAVSGTAYEQTANVQLTATETPLAGYTASAWGGDCAADGTITLAPGDAKTCTITNDDAAPTLTLVKTVVNDNGGNKQVSDFPLFIDGVAAVSGTAYAQAANVQLTATETPQAGYTASVWGGDCAADGTITLQPGDAKTCTITNDDVAPRLTLVKTVVNDNGGNKQVSDFPLFINGVAAVSGTAYEQTANVPLTATETPQAGYTASAWGGDCAADGTITLAPGDDKTCTITNDDVAPTLTLVKTVVNDNGGDKQVSDFPLFINGVAAVSGTAYAQAANVQLTATETPQAGYTASAWGGDCAADGTITLQPGDAKTCTITNSDNAPSLRLVKVVDNSLCAGAGCADEGDFTLTAAGPTGFSGPGPTVDNGASFDAGTYTLSETNVTGYSAGAWSCVGGTQNASQITVGLGESATCTITNTAVGAQIRVLKTLVPDTDSGLFNLRIGGVVKAANVGDDGDTGFVIVQAGASHTIDETAGTGTTLSDYVSKINCGGSDISGTSTSVTPALNSTTTCVITNTKRGMVEIKKITNGGVHPELDIKFTLYETKNHLEKIDGDVELETLSTKDDLDGILQFTTKLVPGTTYTVCENPVPAGWTSMWTIGFSIGGQIVTPYNPNALDTPPQDLGLRCFNFTVDPGQTAQYEVHNDFPGGDPRTIGYWKNWNRCTAGGQAVNADRNGGSENGFFLLEDVLPQLIGDFNVTTCQQAIRILSKQDQSGKNKAADAAYELAAQLLAAKANLAVGATTCPAVQQAVLDAQALLDGINFTGSGNYLDSKVKGALLVKRTQALALAKTLDQYNNGNLCP